jgi:hypothetical protein
MLGRIPVAWALIPALSRRSCRPNARFAELVCLSKSCVAEEYYAERSGNRWVRELPKICVAPSKAVKLILALAPQYDRRIL